MDDIQLVTPNQKLEVILAKSRVIEWSANYLRELVQPGWPWSKAYLKNNVTPSRKLSWTRCSCYAMS